MAHVRESPNQVISKLSKSSDPMTASAAAPLDIETLGGAGFASQFQYPASENEGSKSSNDGVWDLSAYEGIELDVGAGDGKVYTLLLKDEEAQDKRDDGREKAGLNWEADFRASKGSQGRAGEDVVGKKVWIPWRDLKPTYRGKEKEDAGKFKPSEIRRIGFMMRRFVSQLIGKLRLLIDGLIHSFFGTQQGDFRLELRSITARKHASDDTDTTVNIQE
ncbi:MAG: hypothetical protein Q9199_007710 [Rusavskia elegans]